VITMEMFGKVRRMYTRDKKSLREIALDFMLHILNHCMHIVRKPCRFSLADRWGGLAEFP
jgi:hypothetical protein